MSILWIFCHISINTLSAQLPQYCASKGTFPWEQWMERVSISSGNFSNASGKEGYGDFTSLTGASIKRNTGNLVTISPKSSWNGDLRNANMFWRVWVDFNGDGDFTDAGETVISRQVVIQSQTFLDNEAAFTPPSSARLGKTRLRVAMKVGGYPETCETFERGEVEDYTVEIVDITDPNSCRCIANNPGLSTQDFTAFCSNNAGACSVLADLTLQNLTIPTPSPQGIPWTVQQGQVINFAFDIKNIGTGNATNNFTVKSYISKDNTLSTDDIQNGIVPTGNFDAGFSVLQVPGAAIIPPDLAIGSYYLILKVDADNQIEESNENNNVLVSTTPFSVILGQTNNNYCASKGVAPWELWVSKVQFNTINNESEKFKDYATHGYSDYSNLSTSISKGQTYLLNVTPGLSWAGYLPNVYCRAWIDYNGNKVFENTELVFQNTNVNPFWANIRVPSSAINGSVRMRIALKWGGFPEPCEVLPEAK